MSGFTGLDLSVFADATTDVRQEIAEGIADEVKQNYPTVTVQVTGATVSVTTFGSFDHFKEWGSVNNAPKAYMRRAASARGGYKPEGK